MDSAPLQNTQLLPNANIVRQHAAAYAVPPLSTLLLVLIRIQSNKNFHIFKNIFSCATWVSNGFCSSSFYSVAQKCQYCAFSCNLCSTCASTSSSSLAGSSAIVACTDSSTS